VQPSLAAFAQTNLYLDQLFKLKLHGLWEPRLAGCWLRHWAATAVKGSRELTDNGFKENPQYIKLLITVATKNEGWAIMSFRKEAKGMGPLPWNCLLLSGIG
jgi:hypothetical protein